MNAKLQTTLVPMLIMTCVAIITVFLGIESPSFVGGLPTQTNADVPSRRMSMVKSRIDGSFTEWTRPGRELLGAYRFLSNHRASIQLGLQDNDKFESLKVRLDELFAKQEQGALHGDEICEQQT